MRTHAANRNRCGVVGEPKRLFQGNAQAYRHAERTHKAVPGSGGVLYVQSLQGRDGYNFSLIIQASHATATQGDQRVLHAQRL